MTGEPMSRSFTLDYWLEDGWYVGKLREVPNVFSQGESLEELKDNIQDAYQLMMEDAPGHSPSVPGLRCRHRM